MCRHPTAAFFHIIFKLVSIVMYLFGGLFGQGLYQSFDSMIRQIILEFMTDFLSIFVLLILLISFDFWTVKNVTGRLLVGLRWWNFIDDEGRSHWIFENKNDKKDNSNDESFKVTDRLSDNTADSTIFWTALIIAPILWFILLLVTVFRLNVQWFVCVFYLIERQLIH